MLLSTSSLSISISRFLPGICKPKLLYFSFILASCIERKKISPFDFAVRFLDYKWDGPRFTVLCIGLSFFFFLHRTFCFMFRSCPFFLFWRLTFSHWRVITNCKVAYGAFDGLVYYSEFPVFFWLVYVFLHSLCKFSTALEPHLSTFLFMGFGFSIIGCVAPSTPRL